jgi:hypothetical protein
MMTEKLHDTQPLMERDVPPAPVTSPLTNPVIVPGYDGAPSFEKNESVELEHVEREPLELEISNFKKWLAFNVKNELVAQHFKANGVPQDPIQKFSDVSLTVLDVVETERSRQLSEAGRIEDISLPQAKQRFQPVLDSANPYLYWQDDIANLQSRLSQHYDMVKYIDDLEQGDEWLSNLTNEYIGLTMTDAQKEIIDILDQQNRNKDIELRAMKTTFEALKAEGIEKALQAQAEIDSRDAELVIREAQVIALTEQAREYAA